MNTFDTIKWLLNHPPTHITRCDNPGKCDYCDNLSDLRIVDEFAVCSDCVKKVLDYVLRGEK